MDKLISLDDHDKKALAKFQLLIDNGPCKNGIACPVCDEELYDTNPSITLVSFPPKKNIHCINCKYIGYRVS